MSAPESGTNDHAVCCEGSGEGACASGTPLASTGCPPPLVWSHVVAAFEEQSLKIELGEGALRRRYWVLGEGPPLYLLGNLHATPAQLSLLVWLLKETFCCVLSEPQDWETTVTNVTTDAQLLDVAIREFQHVDPLLVGMGYGSAVGLQYATHFAPASRLVLQAPTLGRGLSWGEQAAAWWYRQSRRPLARCWGWKAWVERMYGRWFPPLDPSRREYLVVEAGRVPVRVVAQRALSLAGWAVAAHLPRLTGRILLVGTEGEGTLTEHDRLELLRLHPMAETHWLHTTGRLPALTHPHRLATLLRTFAGIEAAAGTAPVQHARAAENDAAVMEPVAVL